MQIENNFKKVYNLFLDDVMEQVQKSTPSKELCKISYLTSETGRFTSGICFGRAVNCIKMQSNPFQNI